ncbi:hypothetical protein [Peribacillus asahii]|uniref:hypothetical protein n=1 Tax=Peribacillus asahii TaxID=228899 RepID=UPI00207AAA5B|nr:hypothetical protein [Peribacillus asahii]USK71778.1 hypothetical protein LIS76_08495 [Peribacillus asahii]
MTMIAALNAKEWFGAKLNKIIVVGDSRITRPSKITGKFESQFDSAQKVIPLTPNVMIGVAGDYQFITVINDLKSYLEKLDSGKQRYQRFIGFLKYEIRDFLIDKFKQGNYLETDLFIIVKNHESNVKKLYKLVLPDGIFVELPNGLHVIGDSAVNRKIFHENFEENIPVIMNGNMNVDDSAVISIPLRMAFNDIQSIEVGGRIHCFAMENRGWVNLGGAEIFNDGMNSVATALGENGIVTQINGKEIEVLTGDYKVIDKKLGNNVKSVLRNDEDLDI